MVKQKQSFCCTTKTSIIDTTPMEKNIFKANGSKKQTREVILISIKIDFKPKVIRRYREEH